MKNFEIINEEINRLFLRNNHFFVSKKQIIYLKDIIYFYVKSSVVLAKTIDDSYKINGKLNELEKLLQGIFIRTHRNFLVSIDKINGISRRYPADSEEAQKKEKEKIVEECKLHIEGIKRTIPVTRTYSENIKELFKIKSFQHLVPDNKEDKKFRDLGIIRFGWRELRKLDVNNSEIVKSFIEKWDIKKFNRETMIKHFRQVGIKEIDKRKVIKNIIFQLYTWIKKGIEPQSDGNIRSLWYRIKAVLAYHSNVLEPGDVDIFYDVLTEMIETNNLFKYKDFGFMDMNEAYRGIGSRRPQIILASEKIGHYAFIRKMADKTGCSFICLKGEPAHISLEYFSDDLMEEVGNIKKSVFVISDIDPAGFSIENNLVEGLERHGHEIKKVVPLVTLEIFEDDEIGYIRYPVVRFEKKNNEIIPIPPASIGQITKARDWYYKFINDDRLFSMKIIDKRKIYTIWGIESDAADRRKIEEKFYSFFELSVW